MARYVGEQERNFFPPSSFQLNAQQDRLRENGDQKLVQQMMNNSLKTINGRDRLAATVLYV